MARLADAVTTGPGGRVLTNCNVWSPDGEWIAYDTRSDPAGGVFDGTRIEAVHVRTGEVRTLYQSRNGACCGVVTWHPILMRVAFILGPEYPTADWSYGPARRQGMTVDFDRPGVATTLDARDLSGQTPGALRGGSHVHVWHPSGELVSFTYEDAVTNDGLRTVGLSVCGRPVTVPKSHPRNHDGSAFSVLVPHITASPRPGSDEVCWACEEGWVGLSRTLAFQGTVAEADGRRVPEVFAVDVLDCAGGSNRPSPLGGEGGRRPGEGSGLHPPPATPATRQPRTPHPTFGHPLPQGERDDSWPAPVGVSQRRLTRGGVGGPRHWLRSDPTGTRIGFLRPDAASVAQFWTVTLVGESRQVTRLPTGVGSAFTWHPDGQRVAFVSGTQVVLCDTATGAVQPLTLPCHLTPAPRPEACVVSPDGRRVAFVRHVAGSNQVCVAKVPS